MIPYKYVKTCANRWGVSVLSGNGKHLLHCYKFHNGYKLMQKADCYDKNFPDSESAFKYAYEHGYLDIYYRKNSKYQTIKNK